MTEKKYRITDFEIGDIIVWEWGAEGYPGHFVEICRVYAIEIMRLKVNTLFSTTEGNTEYVIDDYDLSKDSFHVREVHYCSGKNVNISELFPEYMI